jgi:hypothetical protein
MSGPKRMLIIGSALITIGVSVGILALFRVQEARDFSRPYPVQTRAGTNFVMRILETSVGKVDTGFVVIVYMRLENPNAFSFEVRRNRFVLAGDGRGDFFRPSIMGTQDELIKLPANGVLEREMLSYTVPDDAIDGMLGLRIGRNFTILLKERGAFGGKLGPGEFRSFHRPTW